MGIADIIIQKIKENGPIPFNDYMDMALYYPDLGYYSSASNRTGKKGDFFTSPYISSAFGAMIGRQLEEIWQQTGGKFTIVEFGSGTGILCHDILQYIRNQHQEFYDNLQYILVEKSDFFRKQSQKYLSEKVSWCNDIEALEPFRGCVISNELFDNFPVHKVSMEGGQIMEAFVDYQGGFREIIKPAEIKIVKFINSLRMKIPEGCSTEICLDAAGWFRKISNRLIKGYLITIDYGYLTEELFNQEKSRETIRCYFKHQVNGDPYIRVGEQDITADVNFSALNFWGSLSGLEFTGFVDQGRFLRALGLVPYLTNMEETEENKRFALNVLLNEMGNKFKVFIQRKELPYKHLLGLSFEQHVEKRLLDVKV